MLTIIAILTFIIVTVLWFRKRPKPERITDGKPSWAIGYALFFLTDIFTRGVSNNEVLNYIVGASRDGLPNLTAVASQSAVVGLKAYANTQGELSKINTPFVISSLSEAVAVEARTALQMATTQANIESYLKVYAPDINDVDLQQSSRELSDTIQKTTMNEEGTFALCELLKHYLERSFERRHGKSRHDFSYDALQKLTGQMA